MEANKPDSPSLTQKRMLNIDKSIVRGNNRTIRFEGSVRKNAPISFMLCGVYIP
jgi:hypothetical protein